MDGLRDSKGRHRSADWCKKVSGGHFFSPWENPLVSEGTPCGCGQKPILSVTTSLAEPPNIYYRCWVVSLFTYEIVSKFWNLTFIYDVTTVFPRICCEDNMDVTINFQMEDFYQFGKSCCYLLINHDISQNASS